MSDAGRLLPTHSCFDDTFELLEGLARSLLAAGLSIEQIQARLNELTLFHGLCLMPSGDLYAHAWIREREHVIQAAILDGKRVYYKLTTEEFERCWSPTADVTAYSTLEASRENIRFGTQGPWLDRYREHCGPSSSPRTWSLPSTIEVPSSFEIVAFDSE